MQEQPPLPHTQTNVDVEIAERQRAYYNEIASVYDQHYHHPYAVAYRHELYNNIIGQLDLKDAYVLDAMCGGGENTAYFLSRGAIVQGLDISDEQCRIYAQRYPNCSVDRSSILETGYPDNYFDFVVVESLHHLHPNLGAGVLEITRVLKPNGHLLIWEPSSRSILDLVRKIWYKLDKKYFLDNEKSVALSEVTEATGGQLTLVQHRYGGNFAFLLIFSSMHFRLPFSFIERHANTLMRIERLLNKIQGRWLACWVLALYKKIDVTENTANQHIKDN